MKSITALLKSVDGSKIQSHHEGSEMFYVCYLKDTPSRDLVNSLAYSFILKQKYSFHDSVLIKYFVLDIFFPQSIDVSQFSDICFPYSLQRVCANTDMIKTLVFLQTSVCST